MASNRHLFNCVSCIFQPANMCFAPHKNYEKIGEKEKASKKEPKTAYTNSGQQLNTSNLHII